MANGKTAHWIAAVRARETKREDSLFKDPFAEKLAGKAGRSFMAKSEEMSGSDNQYIVIRTKFFDEFIKEEYEKIQQIVLLGAGFDTRFLRLGLNKKTVIFEIDKEEILKEKEQKLQEIYSDVEVNAVKRVSVPAELSDNWMDCLLSKGYDKSRKTIWVAEGLFFYLSMDIVEKMVYNIDELSAAGSKLIFDSSGTGLLTLPSMSKYIDYLKRNNLPLPFCTDYPEKIFLKIGWNDVNIDYVGSKTANYGRVKTFEQDITMGKRQQMNSYFVIGTKTN